MRIHQIAKKLDVRSKTFEHENVEQYVRHGDRGQQRRGRYSAPGRDKILDPVVALLGRCGTTREAVRQLADLYLRQTEHASDYAVIKGGCSG
jgi:hypothetical protein